MNIYDLLEMAAQCDPERVILRAGGADIRYGDLRDHAQGAAAFFARRPERANVAFLGENSPAFPAALFGAALAGRPFTPLNYRLPDDQIAALLRRLSPVVAIVDDEMTARVQEGEGVAIVSRSAFEASMAEGAAEALSPCTDASDVAVALFTSGTTSAPKQALLRHGHLFSYVVQSVDFLDCDPGEASLVCVPPYHIAGVAAVLTACYGGRRLVQLSAFTPDAWIDCVEQSGATHAMVVPTMLGRILEALEARGSTLPGLRALAYGGGPMPAPVVRRALDLLPHVNFVNAYGLTETSSTIALLGPDDHRVAHASNDPVVAARLGSVGRPVPGVEVQVREDGWPLGPGEVGEIWVRGPQVSGEYAHGSALDAEGWFPTRDRGYLDHDGYLYLGGRADDVIVRGGENISPGEIEDVLRTAPSVADVAVIGVPDDEWGEAPVAFVVPVPGAEVDVRALAELVRARLRSTRVPREIHGAEDLPYNDMGKLLRRDLQARYRAAHSRRVPDRRLTGKGRGQNV